MTNEHQRLVSVESQSEYNLTSGKSETRIFVKMYVDAVKKGLIADIGADTVADVMCPLVIHERKGRMLPDAGSDREGAECTKRGRKQTHQGAL